MQHMLSHHNNCGEVVLWTKGDSCTKSGRHSAKAKELLKKHAIEFREISLTEVSTPILNQITSALALDTGYLNFPNIYYGTTHIGGLDDLKSHLQFHEALKLGKA